MPDEETERETLECPKGIEGHGGDRVRRYPDGRGSSVVMCLDCKSDREKAVRRDPSLKGTGEKQGKAPREMTFQRNANVAALIGGGMPLAQIAKVDGRTEESLKHAIKNKIQKDSRLLEILNDARLEAAQKTVPKALAVVDRLLDKIDSRMESYKDTVGVSKDGNAVIGTRTPGPKELAGALREVGYLSGMARASGAGPRPEEGAGFNVTNNIHLSIDALREVLKWKQDLDQKRERVIEGERIS